MGKSSVALDRHGPVPGAAGLAPVPRIVSYRSLAGGVCDATILAHALGQATIDVCGVTLSRIPLLEADDGRRGACFPSHAA